MLLWQGPSARMTHSHQVRLSGVPNHVDALASMPRVYLRPLLCESHIVLSKKLLQTSHRQCGMWPMTPPSHGVGFLCESPLMPADISFTLTDMQIKKRTCCSFLPLCPLVGQDWHYWAQIPHCLQWLCMPPCEKTMIWRHSLMECLLTPYNE